MNVNKTKDTFHLLLLLILNTVSTELGRYRVKCFYIYEATDHPGS